VLRAIVKARTEGYKQGRVDLNQEWSQELQGALELDVARAEGAKAEREIIREQVAAMTCQERGKQWPWSDFHEWLEARAKEAAP